MAIDALKERGASNIKFVCLVAAPEGVKALQEAHPDIDIYTASLDEKLNEHGYIVPGLGMRVKPFVWYKISKYEKGVTQLLSHPFLVILTFDAEQLFQALCQ